MTTVKLFESVRKSFRDTLDTDLFFRTRQHEEALVKIRLGIQDRHALILISGRSGTGKTLVAQAALRSMDPYDFEPCFVFVHPGMGKGPLLGSILRELDVENVARFTNDRVAQIQEEALSLFSMGRRLVIVIDEAHFLKSDGLHILRTLSNLETERQKIVTVLLVAEKSLPRRLNAPSYASLRGRITFTVNLRPLSAKETEQYIKYRLLKGGASSNLVSKEACLTAYRLSGGIPREINRLMYNSLIEAMIKDETMISTSIVQAADMKIGVSHG
ncbi:MAG: AAA family ATPase [Desulfobulbaceae bacterium]|nr:AAA family ATPase [Desulfobulbaceae bacterium]MCK5436879.1 AAA family ATPase [Desulfobulbaceae bacterium]MCK5544284.1 AAA family ATPase [Desulfobulbaceae bacterium]